MFLILKMIETEHQLKKKNENLRHKDSERLKSRDLQVRTDNIFHGLSALFFILFSSKMNDITFNSGTDKLVYSF